MNLFLSIGEVRKKKPRTNNNNKKSSPFFPSLQVWLNNDSDHANSMHRLPQHDTFGRKKSKQLTNWKSCQASKRKKKENDFGISSPNRSFISAPLIMRQRAPNQCDVRMPGVEKLMILPRCSDDIMFPLFILHCFFLHLNFVDKNIAKVQQEKGTVKLSWCQTIDSTMGFWTCTTCAPRDVCKAAFVTLKTMSKDVNSCSLELIADRSFTPIPTPTLS